VLGRECERQNEVFFHYIRTKTPFVVLKYAMTADGKIATRTGASRWITGEAARLRAHRDRLRYSAVMVGVGTVLADDPLLTCRIPGGRNPVRVICDSRLRTPLSSRLVRTAGEVPTILASCETDPEKAAPYLAAGCTLLAVPEQNGYADLGELMRLLGARQLDSVLLEGGAALNFSALNAGIVNRVQAYIAPRLFGGERAKTPVGGQGVETPDRAFRLKGPKITRIEEDILLEWEVENYVHGDR
jgi:diaminohydroxyphosphoribosylaminopyrimidine deaminase/5-amino-6-(5-phosphoribosylamino)uracil reductase